MTGRVLFPSPEGRGLKVRVHIQRASFGARFKDSALLRTRAVVMQSSPDRERPTLVPEAAGEGPHPKFPRTRRGDTKTSFRDSRPLRDCPPSHMGRGYGLGSPEARGTYAPKRFGSLNAQSKRNRPNRDHRPRHDPPHAQLLAEKYSPHQHRKQDARFPQRRDLSHRAPRQRPDDNSIAK